MIKKKYDTLHNYPLKKKLYKLDILYKFGIVIDAYKLLIIRRIEYLQSADCQIITRITTN